MARRTKWTVAILGAMLAGFLILVLVANIRNASHRRSYAETERILMRNGTLLEVHRWRTGSYPDPGYSGFASQLPSLATLDAVSSSLGVQYPWEINDGWGNALTYIAEPDGLHYALVSGGSNGAVDQTAESLLIAHSVIDAFDEDVVFKDGGFFRWRQGWCCNPTFQEEGLPELEDRIRRGMPARLEE